jgi:hypothetical protein
MLFIGLADPLAAKKMSTTQNYLEEVKPAVRENWNFVPS